MGCKGSKEKHSDEEPQGPTTPAAAEHADTVEEAAAVAAGSKSPTSEAASAPPPPPPPPSGPETAGGPPPPPPPPGSGAPPPPPPPGGAGVAFEKNARLTQYISSGDAADRLRWVVFVQARLRFCLHRVRQRRERRKFDHMQAQPIKDLFSIDWSQAQAIQRSSGGRSSGVYFVMFEEKKAVIVKPEQDIAAEMLGTTLAQFLDIRSPVMRMEPMDKSVGQSLLKNLCRLDDEKPESEREGLAKVFDLPYVLVMQYIRGRTLRDLAFQTEEDRLAWCTRVFGPQGKLSPDGRRRLREIGSIIAFDVFVHNFDRLPSVWDNKGNLENLMFDEHDDPVAIDSLISCFDPSMAPSTFATYCDRVRDLVYHIYTSPEKPSPALTRVRDVFRNGVGTMADENFTPSFNYDIGEEGVLEIQAGFKKVCPKLRFMNGDVLEAVYNRILGQIMGHISKKNTLGLERVNVEFLQRIGAVFREKGATKLSRTDTLKTTQYKVLNWSDRTVNLSVFTNNGMETIVHPRRDIERVSQQTISRAKHIQPTSTSESFEAQVRRCSSRASASSLHPVFDAEDETTGGHDNSEGDRPTEHGAGDKQRRESQDSQLSNKGQRRLKRMYTRLDRAAAMTGVNTPDDSKSDQPWYKQFNFIDDRPEPESDDSDEDSD